MKAVIQRVKWAEVWVVRDGNKDAPERVARIEKGILTLLGVEKGDSEVQAHKLVDQICGLRIFSDAQGKMNLNVSDAGGAHLMVSQFTLAADVNTGRRPSFTRAAAPDEAMALYEVALAESRKKGIRTESGVFRADMRVRLENDGPVTFVLESRR